MAQVYPSSGKCHREWQQPKTFLVPEESNYSFPLLLCAQQHDPFLPIPFLPTNCCHCPWLTLGCKDLQTFSYLAPARLWGELGTSCNNGEGEQYWERQGSTILTQFNSHSGEEKKKSLVLNSSTSPRQAMVHHQGGLFGGTKLSARGTAEEFVWWGPIERLHIGWGNTGENAQPASPLHSPPTPSAQSGLDLAWPRADIISSAWLSWVRAAATTVCPGMAHKISSRRVQGGGRVRRTGGK